MNALIFCVSQIHGVAHGTTKGAVPGRGVEPKTIVKDLIKKTGIAKKPVLVKDFYETVKEQLPPDFRYEIERFIEIHPTYKIPKVDVRTVKNGKNEDIQLSWIAEKTSLIGLISLRGEHQGSITYTRNGKNIRRAIGLIDLNNPTRLISSVAGKGSVVFDQQSFIQFLTAPQLAQLPTEKQKAALGKMLAVVQSMERVQLAWIKQNQKNTGYHNLWFSQTSYASTENSQKIEVTIGKPCLTRGNWIGTFSEGGICAPPAEAKVTGCEVCNSLIHGSKSGAPPICVSAGPETGSSFCQNKGKEQGFVSDFSKLDPAKMSEDLNKLSLYLNRLRELCSAQDLAEPVKKECAELTKIVQDLQNSNCQTLANTKAQELPNYCAPTQPLGQPPSEPPTNALAMDSPPRETPIPPAPMPPGPGLEEVPLPPPPPPAGPNRAHSADRNELANGSGPAKKIEIGSSRRCDNLPTSEPNCGSGQVHAIQCPDRSQAVYFYCKCEDTRSERRTGGLYPVGCDGNPRYGSYDRDNNDRRGSSVSRDSQGESGFMDTLNRNKWPIIGLIGTAALMSFLIYANKSSNLEQMRMQSQVMMPTYQNTVAPPITNPPAPVNTTLPGFPVIPGRPPTAPSTGPPAGYTYPPQPGRPPGVLRDGNRPAPIKTKPKKPTNP